MNPAAPGRATRLMQTVLGTRLVSAAWRRARPGGLRVLAYHGIVDAVAFDLQLQHVVRHYAPVSSGQVLAWLHDGAALPKRAVWVTFDDGIEDVVRLGLPALQRHRVPATLFVCPALIDTARLHWWQVVERAAAAGLLDAPIAEVTRRMKSVDDTTRRSAIGELETRLAAAGEEAGRQLTTGDLRRWTAAGNDLGNHSLDHPLLDRCSADEQRHQVVAAHEWVTGFLGAPPTTFAWPNGDAAEPALDELRALDYRAVLVCDHRIARDGDDAMGLSRLRIDADAPVARLRSVVSGAHPAAFALQRRLRRRR